MKYIEVKICVDFGKLLLGDFTMNTQIIQDWIFKRSHYLAKKQGVKLKEFAEIQTFREVNYEKMREYHSYRFEVE